jgi:uncharacterized protein (TIGR00661 family)
MLKIFAFYPRILEITKIDPYLLILINMRIMLCCSELGLGHVSRIMPLGKKLQENGHEVSFFSGGKAYQLLQKEFKNVHHCTPVVWYENSRGILVYASLMNILLPLPIFNIEKNKIEFKNSNAMETIHRYYDLRRQIKKPKPDLIIVDGDIHALRLASRWKIPSVYITNIIRPSYDFSAIFYPGERIIERYLKHCLRIIIPDIPPPNTVCEFNLGDLESIGIRDKVDFVGSFIDTSPVDGSQEHIFAPISGSYGTRAKLSKLIVPVLRNLNLRSIVSLGMIDRKEIVRKKDIEIYPWLTSEKRMEVMKNAKIIIFSGGHGTCFETIKFEKPSICIPTQPEQMGNAAKLQKLKCSILVRNQKELTKAIETIESKNKIYRKKIRELNRHSRKTNGLIQAVKIVESV